MLPTSMTRCLVRSRRVLARRGHGGAAQAQRELERLALLEHSMLQPPAVRARQTPAVAQAAAAAYLREVPDRVERARAAAAGSTVAGSSTAMKAAASASASAVDEPQVSNLTQFLSACKKLKIRYSSDSDAASRRRGREALCAFWARHASSAVACCFQGVREVGFVADYGLADTRMHLNLPELWVMLRVLKAERAVASSFDATRILQYLARELQYMECDLSATSHRRGPPPSSTGNLPSPADTLAFRQTLTDLAVDLLTFYFVVHSPSINALPQLTREGNEVLEKGDHDVTVTASSSSLGGVSIATAVDALSGLEVLAVLTAHDAREEVIEKVWERRHLGTLRRQREPAMVAAMQTSPAFPSGAASSSALAHEVHYLLVAELFRFAAVQRRDLRVTDVVHGFALLRVHLRTLWPPYARYGNNPDGSGGRSNDAAQRQSLWYEKDSLFRITWGLAVALVSKDRKLVSSYHYVKIVTTLAKLPAFVLAPTPAPKREIRRFEFPLNANAGRALQSRDAESPETNDDLQNGQLSILSEIPPELRPRKRLPEAEHANSASQDKNAKEFIHDSKEEEDEVMVALRPADFWRFIISKACVFVPSLPPDQRRVVCRSLHLAITEKRGHLLRDGGQQGPPSHHDVPSQGRRAPSKFGRIAARFAYVPGDAEHSDAAADILFPLVEEMATYTENYDVCTQDTRKPAQRVHREATIKKGSK
ncbi:hypothetical protein ABB37_02877 [Leptomonas pyrrhocoris]|uniref:Uncharacterized protein n=1 Tax=Leptomonas pyrrhocoris TaxID=157538 RepID=A0A0N0DXN5_LEPPY|nr:hypothetical protein ABB37_02877 [Leptomonas pyrrhocoris]KPA83188.1 hypothetical protein ABB37_02877 [Leptomonas pyrrhocoris]|eukprot:XP_015661627.1 hypothetical protein ABB37_02877 [Leptomonas pyrrhocoris]